MKAQNSLRWMLVDDEETVLTLIGNLVQAVSGVEVACFSRPQDAIQALREDPHGYELVISDFNMPEMNGIEMCHVLRELAPELKTVLATGNTGISEIEAATEGFDALLHKPFPFSQLKAVLDKLTKQSSASPSRWLEAA